MQDSNDAVSPHYLLTGSGTRLADGQDMHWLLVAFNDDDDSWHSASLIAREQFLRLRELFDYGDDKWFANSYPVLPELWPQVIEILSCSPPPPGLSYFIEGAASDR